jgi:hemerythrin-like metal-binding protein
MSDFFVWDPKNLAVGVAAMDEEHQVLIRKMNALHAAYARKAPRAELEPLVEDFTQYTVTHFADEEAHMARIRYAGLESHKGIHASLLGRVQGHVKDFRETGALTDAFFSFLAFWLTSHIRGIDIKYGQAG